MPRAPKRCAKYPECRNLQPCPVRGHQRASGTSATLPPNWKSLVTAVRKRDRDICQVCRRKTDHPEVDHIVPRWLRPELSGSLNNLRVLCKRCHGVKTANDKSLWRSRRKFSPQNKQTSDTQTELPKDTERPPEGGLSDN